MIINVDKSTLLKSLLIAESVISSKNINTILSNCLFSVSNGEIEIIATDNEIAVRTKVDAITDSKSSFTVNGKKFSSILKELPEDELIISVNESLQIDIKTKASSVKGHYTLVGTSGEEYPEIPEFNYDNSIEINQQLFKDALKKVLYAASSDQIKPVFNGVFLTSEGKGKLTAVATDSRRLAIISKAIGGEVDFGEGVIIPLKTIHEIFLLLESSGNCTCSIHNNQFFFKVGKTEIISRLVDGQFPNFKQVIPKEYILEAVIETKRLLESIKRAMIFTREPANKIIVHFKNDTLLLEAKTPELGEAEEEIEIQSKSKEQISIGINAQFLIDCLKEIGSNSIVCRITGQMSPVTIIPEDDDTYLSVIMPIQIKSQQPE